jgi:hypothetical protein
MSHRSPDSQRCANFKVLANSNGRTSESKEQYNVRLERHAMSQVFMGQMSPDLKARPVHNTLKLTPEGEMECHTVCFESSPSTVHPNGCSLRKALVELISTLQLCM